MLGVDHLVRADLAAVERLDDPVLRRRARHVVTEAARVEPSRRGAGGGCLGASSASC